MKLWLLTTQPPVSEDTAYLIGRVTSRCKQVAISEIAAPADEPPLPPDDIDGILNRSFSTSSGFLASLDSLGIALGVPVINPGAATIKACDKRSYPGLFAKLIPETWTVARLDRLYELLEGGRRELVVKNPFGKHGKEVIRFRGEEDHAEAEALFAAAPRGGLAVQVFCPGFLAGDKRIILQRGVGGSYQIAAWFKRVPKAGGWKSNVSAGGSIERCELDEDEKALAMEVALGAGLDYVGIDVAREGGRPLLIETNAYTGGHINFDTDRREHSGDDFARMVVGLAENGRP